MLHEIYHTAVNVFKQGPLQKAVVVAQLVEQLLHIRIQSFILSICLLSTVIERRK